MAADRGYRDNALSGDIGDAWPDLLGVARFMGRHLRCHDTLLELREALGGTGSPRDRRGAAKSLPQD